jgi:hypothetical protein
LSRMNRTSSSDTITCTPMMMPVSIYSTFRTTGVRPS